ncbi:hypothetical protein PIB30_016386 [Stylosanthes scabra]|uniref:Aminotransferase-like plant mobile domain-containing protein n=1 Tax=Stylosanthes scabra TaxID=79078 RepID=A0ABU6U6M5_9FABA|nr:hypothetical protein [Stylosanthes scabra]
MSHAAYVLNLLQASVLGSKSNEAPHLSARHQVTWRGRRGNNDYSEARLVRYRERLDLLSIDDVSYTVQFKWMPYNAASIIFVVPQEFRGAPHGDFFTSAVPLIFFRFIESARNDDVWCPDRLAEWFVAWNNRRSAERRLVIDPAVSLDPSRQYFEWYKERIRRFLSNPSRFYDPRAVDIPPEAPVGYGDSPIVAWPDMPQDCRRWRRGSVVLGKPSRRSLEGMICHSSRTRTMRHHSGHLSILIRSIIASSHSNRHKPSPCLIFYTGLAVMRLGVHHRFTQTLTDLGLSLSPSAMQAPPLQGRHSVSHLDTVGSAFRHYDPDVMQGRRLSFADDTPQEEPQGRPSRARRAPSCGTDGRLGHDDHEH